LNSTALKLVLIVELLETIEIESLGIDITPRIKVISVTESGTKDRASKQISSAEEFFSELNQLGVL